MLSYSGKLNKIYGKLNNQFNNHPKVKNFKVIQSTQHVIDECMSILEAPFF